MKSNPEDDSLLISFLTTTRRGYFRYARTQKELHNLKNHLMGLQGELLRLKKGEITQSAYIHYTSRLIDTVFEVAKGIDSYDPKTDQYQRLCLNTVLTDTYKQLQAITPKDLSFNLTLEEEGMYTFSSKEDISSVVANLVYNSLTSIRQHPFLDVSEGEISVVMSKKDGEDHLVDICVSDNGKGISQEKINELLTQPIPPPNSIEGFGIPYIKEIVDRNGGEISINSIVHQGTQFHIYLPSTQKTT